MFTGIIVATGHVVAIDRERAATSSSGSMPQRSTSSAWQWATV